MESILAEMHTHLFERNVKPERYWHFVKKAGLHVVCITEHAEYNPKRSFDLIKAKQPSDLILVPGIELNTSIGHVLLYGPDERIYAEPKLLMEKVDMDYCVEYARKNDCLLVLAHPFGFNHDSAYYFVGMEGLRHYCKRNGVGIEAYNGLVGKVSELALESNWVKTPLKFFGWLEKNKVTRLAQLSRIGAVMKKRMDVKMQDLIERSTKSMEFAEECPIITAGSDAHQPDKIGTVVMKLKADAKDVQTPGDFIALLRNKENVLWAGPAIEEKDGRMVKKKVKFGTIETLRGVSYGVKNAVKKGLKTKFDLKGARIGDKGKKKS